jgi:serine/threonine protein kinase
LTLNERQEEKLRTRGRIHWIDRKSNIVYKIYKKVNLLDDQKDIKIRLSQIVKLSHSMKFIPETNHSYEEDLLVMKQKRVTKDKKLQEIEPVQKMILIENFSQSLDRLYEEGFIHGDINRKNIIYSEDKLCLIDFEPSLLQLKNQVKQWMSTRPYRHHEDIQNNNITVKSDLLGFGCFIKWFLLNSNPPQYYEEQCSKIITEFKLQSFPFQNLTRLLIQ